MSQRVDELVYKLLTLLKIIFANYTIAMHVRYNVGMHACKNEASLVLTRTRVAEPSSRPTLQNYPPADSLPRPKRTLSRFHTIVTTWKRQHHGLSTHLSRKKHENNTPRRKLIRKDTSDSKIIRKQFENYPILDL